METIVDAIRTKLVPDIVNLSQGRASTQLRQARPPPPPFRPGRLPALPSGCVWSAAADRVGPLSATDAAAVLVPAHCTCRTGAADLQVLRELAIATGSSSSCATAVLPLR